MYRSYVLAAALAFSTPLASVALAAPAPVGVVATQGYAPGYAQTDIDTITTRGGQHRRWFLRAVSDIFAGKVARAR